MTRKLKIQAIIDYWEIREDECGLGVDWAEAHERCWRCGCKAVLQFCHIVPDSLDGPDEPSNLVLLCGRCHREAPNVSDPRFMWMWLRATSVSFYEHYWSIRGIQEFEVIFGRKPFSTPAFRHVDQDLMEAAVGEAMEKATVHFGEGRMNPSTIASVYALVEEALGGTPCEASRNRPLDRYLWESIGFRFRPVEPELSPEAK